MDNQCDISTGMDYMQTHTFTKTFTDINTHTQPYECSHTNTFLNTNIRIKTVLSWLVRRDLIKGIHFHPDRLTTWRSNGIMHNKALTGRQLSAEKRLRNCCSEISIKGMPTINLF